MTRSMFALAMLVATSSAMAAPTSYVFDSISKFDLGKDQVSVTGILQGQTTPTALAWADNVSGDVRHVMNRCVPLLLTMVEKPGRYLFNLQIDLAPPSFGFQTVSCGLELRS